MAKQVIAMRCAWFKVHDQKRRDLGDKVSIVFGIEIKILVFGMEIKIPVFGMEIKILVFRIPQIPQAIIIH